MRRTRTQLLWTFQIYLDTMKIFQPERRERLSAMFLERKLSRPTEKEFLHWLKTNRIIGPTHITRTRGSRLAFFAGWLNRYRPFANNEERERLTRLYFSHSIHRDIEREFHRYMRDEVNV